MDALLSNGFISTVCSHFVDIQKFSWICM